MKSALGREEERHGGRSGSDVYQPGECGVVKQCNAKLSLSNNWSEENVVLELEMIYRLHRREWNTRTGSRTIRCYWIISECRMTSTFTLAMVVVLKEFTDNQ